MQNTLDEEGKLNLGKIVSQYNKNSICAELEIGKF